MNAIRKAGTLLLGAALTAGCAERNTPTAPRLLRSHDPMPWGRAMMDLRVGLGLLTKLKSPSSQ